ncbi:MAG: zinc-ribbon domain-containing protein [Firmicutes bacterium]|nr:zinc-ribbon domain-containing protein [Bacillota bacterium]
MEDKTLVCRACSQEFVFTAGEQEFYQMKGFENEPKDCKDCRIAKKQERRNQRMNRNSDQQEEPT